MLDSATMKSGPNSRSQPHIFSRHKKVLRIAPPMQHVQLSPKGDELLKFISTGSLQRHELAWANHVQDRDDATEFVAMISPPMLTKLPLSISTVVLSLLSSQRSFVVSRISRSGAMASIVATSAAVAPAAFAAAASSAVSTSESTSVRAFSGLKSSTLFASKAQSLSSVQNGSRVQCMQVWNPINNVKFETFSYLPPLSDDAIAKQVEYMIQQKLIPCLEFDMNSKGVTRDNNSSPGYYDGRYWTMWKLPMFGCNDSAQVLREIQECKKTYPTCWVRVLGFDNVKQVQICGFLVSRPE